MVPWLLIKVLMFYFFSYSQYVLVRHSISVWGVVLGFRSEAQRHCGLGPLIWTLKIRRRRLLRCAPHGFAGESQDGILE